jgi:hypothetical protein
MDCLIAGHLPQATPANSFSFLHEGFSAGMRIKGW